MRVPQPVDNAMHLLGDLGLSAPLSSCWNTALASCKILFFFIRNGLGARDDA